MPAASECVAAQPPRPVGGTPHLIEDPHGGPTVGHRLTGAVQDLCEREHGLGDLGIGPGDQLGIPQTLGDQLVRGSGRLLPCRLPAQMATQTRDPPRVHPDEWRAEQRHSARRGQTPVDVTCHPQNLEQRTHRRRHGQRDVVACDFHRDPCGQQGTLQHRQIAAPGTHEYRHLRPLQLQAGKHLG